MIPEYLNGSVLLIADDNIMNLQLLSNYLTRVNFKILVAEDGQEAYERAESGKPDLILLDIMMPPGMNGFETCRKLKENDSTKDIPVIFITALSEIDDKVKGFEVGGVDYITKPFQYEEVLARVTTHLTLRWQQKKLEEALSKVKLLSGFIPICCSCKKIRQDDGFWEQVEVYIKEHSEAEFSHSICPDCIKKLYPEYADDITLSQPD
jgi:DNA-binding response OmpR family regulator